MNILLKKNSIFIFFLSVIIQLKGQVFLRTDTIPTNISKITYEYLPIQSENNFNFLLYSTKNKKQNFELITIKDTVIRRMKIKNQKLDGGGSWYNSAVMDNEKLLLLHVDGFLVVYKKNKKGNYIFKEILNIKGRGFNTISLLDSENVLLANSYNSYNKEKLYDNYALCVFNLRTKKIIHSKKMDMGKGILLSHASVAFSIESKKDKIAMAHPTLPFIYIYNDKLEPIDTVSVDSVINSVFTDSFLKRNRTNPKAIIETILDKKIDQMERIEKIFWLSDDTLGYTIRQPLSRERMFVFYSVSEKRDLDKKMVLNDDNITPYNFTSSGRILINNNKTIWRELIYENDESDLYYMFCIFDKLPFNCTK
jgi:hypothetical protein